VLVPGAVGSDSIWALIAAGLGAMLRSKLIKLNRVKIARYMSSSQ
jgi:hypothetical protein